MLFWLINCKILENTKITYVQSSHEFGKMLIVLGTSQLRIQYIYSALISTKDHQKEVFE